MRIEREWLEELIFHTLGGRRFTQDSPVLPDVWIRYATSDNKPVDLLLTPDRKTSAAELADVVVARLKTYKRRSETGDEPPETAFNLTTVVSRLFFDEMIRVALPLSRWWREYMMKGPEATPVNLQSRSVRTALTQGVEWMANAGKKGVRNPAPFAQSRAWRPPLELLWLVRLAGTILVALSLPEPTSEETDNPPHGEITPRKVVDAFCDVFRKKDLSIPKEPMLFLVSLNRLATASISGSVLAVKADAARRLFAVSAARVNWAVLDTGIDARHTAFQKSGGKSGSAKLGTSRVQATYDFTRVRYLVNPDIGEIRDLIEVLKEKPKKKHDPPTARRISSDLAFFQRMVQDRRATLRRAKELKAGMAGGRSIDWAELEPFLAIPHDKGGYQPPLHDHGTHVAGILGANGTSASEGGEPLIGVCPDIALYDFRVLNQAGQGDEFTIMAGLQFVRFLNATRDTPLIHGINLSLSISHDVANYACGRTPVCDEAERVVASGVVVVVAAGNEGYMKYTTPTGASEGYRSISITDPGNAEAVITVGATHRSSPHTYGVSYFSSRGPTGDGRLKPDLVAPGEKITGPVPGGGYQVKDGTSMAAPHVSGAAALLIARHRELIGQPIRIKKILCETATDLGRERYFQGAGMLDVLRALQRV
jgi:subtilisin family serine protease